jgi:hypothetical protein
MVPKLCAGRALFLEVWGLVSHRRGGCRRVRRAVGVRSFGYLQEGTSQWLIQCGLGSELRGLDSDGRGHQLLTAATMSHDGAL